MGTFLGFISLCESVCCFLFLVTVSSMPLFYLCLLCLISEPILYYLFTAYIAMRNISSVSHLLAMVYSLPFYYVLLMASLLLRIDLYEKPFLSRLIHYSYSPLAFRRQLKLHMGCVTAPGMVVVGVDLGLAGVGVVGGCAFGVLVIAGAAYITTLASKGRKLVIETPDTSLGEVLPTENTGEDDLETL